MSATFIATGTICYKKCDRIKNRLLVGIDQGCSLTKVSFLSKSNKHQLMEDQYEHVTFQYNIYKNEDFEWALRSIHDQAYIPEEEDFKLHLTGVGQFSRRAFLESLFGRKVEIISEELSIAAGITIAFTEIGIGNITKSVIVPLSPQEMINNPFRNYLQSQNKRFIATGTSDPESPFPCLILHYGSANVFLYIDENMKTQFFGMFNTGGKTMMGLAKCLLDINSYEELTMLASKGCRKRVDTQLRDVIETKFPDASDSFLDISIFSFGKCDDLLYTSGDCTREDIALSLISWTCMDIVQNCARAAMIKHVSKIYLNGNVFLSLIFAEELQKIMSGLPFQLTFTILDYGYAGSLATMLCDADEQSKYIKTKQ